MPSLSDHNAENAPDVVTTLFINYEWRRLISDALQTYADSIIRTLDDSLVDDFRNKFQSVLDDLYDTVNEITPPDSVFSYLPFDIIRNGALISISPEFDLRAHANISVTKTYYLNTISGNDGNSGLTALLPKKTWNAIIGTGDYDRIIIQDGSYLIRDESSLQAARSCEVIGEGTVYFTSSRANNLGAWSLASGQTNTYQSTVAGGEFIARVFDEGTLTAQGNPTRYIGRASIALVESNPGSFFWSGGVLYVHTLNSLTPSGRTDLRYYDSTAISWSKDNLIFYFENINFRGGFNMSNASAAGTATKCYLKDCTGHSQTIRGINEFIAQDCHFFTAAGDIVNYDTLNSVVTQAIEIDCEYEDGGTAGVDQASTIHNGCRIVRINGHYHHMTGQDVADGHAASRSWLLGCELHHSSIGDTGYSIQGVAWLDTCYIHDVSNDLRIEAGATLYKHNLQSGGVFSNSGILMDY